MQDDDFNICVGFEMSFDVVGDLCHFDLAEIHFFDLFCVGVVFFESLLDFGECTHFYDFMIQDIFELWWIKAEINF